MSIRLNYACPKIDANMYYWCRCACSASLFAWEVDGKLFALSNILDRPHLQKNGKFERIYIQSEISNKFSFLDLCQFLLKKYNKDTINIPGNFPAKFVQQLQTNKINYNIVEGEFLQERQYKSKDEKKCIKDVCDIISLMYQRVVEILQTSSIASDNTLKYNTQTITSELLKQEIFNIGLKYSVLAEDTIVSCGIDSSQPHNQGSGPILANEFIVVDIFPQSMTTKYFGDITRTFIKGTPSDAQYKLYTTVKNAQQIAINNIGVNTTFHDVDLLVQKYFIDNGYQTENESGYFHSLGHGLGLELHESPKFSNKQSIENDMVFTIEPGLYYSEIGGVRIEDDFAITNDKIDRLSNFNSDWIL